MSSARLHVLSSGSKGNAILVESDGVTLLIDQGFSFRRFQERCNQVGCAPESIAAIVVSHEHLDHINGVPVTARKLGVPVYAAPAVAAYFKDTGIVLSDLRVLSPECPCCIEYFSVEPFPVMHDARDPLGFTVTLPAGTRLSIVTDTGCVTQRIFAQVAASDYLVIEANHDPRLLYANTTYPPDLKQRIRSERGHLSNEQCAEMLGQLPQGRLRKVVFAHLSEENNSPALVRHAAEAGLARCRFSGEAFVASQETPISIALD